MSEPGGDPCMGPFLSRSFGRAARLSLFDREARFFVPTCASLTSARAGAVKVGRRTNLAARSRPYLDGFEHDGTLVRSR
jgi:hypothetical protein